MTIVEHASPRRRNAEATRNAILDAARSVFAREGYDAAGLREISALAGVDAALICRYFGGKEGLFVNVMCSTTDPGEMFCGDPAEFSARIAETLVYGPTDSPKMDCIQIMLRSAASPRAAEVIRRTGDANFYQPIADWLDAPDAAVKARLLGALMMGMGVSRSISPDFDLCPEARAKLFDRLRQMIYLAVTGSLAHATPA